MSAPMVRAILAGTKTQTRRIVKPQPELNPNYSPSRVDRHTTHPEYWWPSNAARSMVSISDMASLGPYGSKGDRLWVRETWQPEYVPGWERLGPVRYRATQDERVMGHRWKPAIHMPRWASRITLEVTGVRVERLHAITEEDARAEGVDWASPEPHGERWDDDREDPCEVGYPPAGASFARDNFRRLWDSINGKRAPWASNPWLWVITFRRVEAAARAA